jgi:hypothetical protein
VGSVEAVKRLRVVIDLNDPSNSQAYSDLQPVGAMQIELRTGTVSHDEIVLRIPRRNVDLTIVRGGVALIGSESE